MSTPDTHWIQPGAYARRRSDGRLFHVVSITRSTDSATSVEAVHRDGARDAWYYTTIDGFAAEWEPVPLEESPGALDTAIAEVRQVMRAADEAAWELQMGGGEER